jgi:hypothetical protein
MGNPIKENNQNYHPECDSESNRLISPQLFVSFYLL